MRRVLIVEDESHIARGLLFNLEAEGFAVEVVEDGEQALRKVRDKLPFDALLVDVMLPGMDGFEVVRRLRSTGCYVPVMMLTARRSPEDIVKGFAAGADDYLPKPFDLAVLLARIGALLRRHRWNADEQLQAVPGTYEFNGRTVDFSRQEVSVDGEIRDLTLMEASLLRYMIANEGRNVSRKSLLADVWGVREDTDTRAIDNFIVRLRRCIEPDPSKPRHLVTVRGVGYRFVAEPGPRLSRRLSGVAARRFRRR